jgi:hypothetical protein
MAAGAAVDALVDELVALFNRRSLDLPDGWFTRHTRLLLNGVPFEAMLGRSPDDPLILMLARGAAGYRFSVKALQHAVPDAMLQRGAFDEHVEGDTQVFQGQCWMSGHLRGSGEPVEIVAGIELRVRGTALLSAEATLDPAIVARLREARLRS